MIFTNKVIISYQFGEAWLALVKFVYSKVFKQKISIDSKKSNEKTRYLLQLINSSDEMKKFKNHLCS